MSLKTLEVKGRLGEGFAVEVECGDHHVIMDQPRAAFGNDTGPTPLEMVLAALAGCFGTIGRFLAHQRKIELRSMHFAIQADYDPNGLLGRDAHIRPGFQALRLQVEIDADLSREQKEAFLREVERRCPLADNLLHGTQLHSELA